MFNKRILLWHLGLPADSKFLGFECFPNIGDTIYYEFRFALSVPLFKSGPRKGKRNYAKAEGVTTHQVLAADEAAICERYEAATGNCMECCGDRKVVRSWSKDGGTQYRPCTRCNETGKAAAGVGPQRAQPASVGRIEAETATAKRQLELLNT